MLSDTRTPADQHYVNVIEGVSGTTSTSHADQSRGSVKDVESQIPVDSYLECRICLDNQHPEDMVSPCSCTGTVKYAHMKCLQRWAAERGSLSCELCAQPYNEAVTRKLEPVIEAAQRTAEDAAVYQAALPDDTLQMTWSRFWCQALLLVALLVGVLYLALFVNVQHGGSGWTVLLWKVFTILLPLYLVGFWLRKTLKDSRALDVLAVRMRQLRMPALPWRQPPQRSAAPAAHPAA